MSSFAMKRFDRWDLYCLIMVFVWGTNMPVVKGVLDEISPLSFNAVRLVLASAVLWLLTWRLGQVRRMPWQDVRRILCLGLIGNTLYQTFFIFGLNLTKAGNVALLLSGATVFTALLSRMLGHESFRGIVWTGIGVSLVGVMLILAESADLSFGGDTLLGDLMIVGCSLCWAVYTVNTKPMMERYTPLHLTAATLSCGSFFFLLFATPSLWSERWRSASPEAYLALGYSFLFALALGYALWFLAIDHLGSTRTAVYGNLVPFVGVMTSWWLLAEPVTWPQLAGGALILTGIFLTRKGRGPEAPAAIRQKQF